MKYSEKLFKKAGKTPFKLAILGKKTEKGLETCIQYEGNNTELLFAYSTIINVIREMSFSTYLDYFMFCGKYKIGTFEYSDGSKAIICLK